MRSYLIDSVVILGMIVFSLASLQAQKDSLPDRGMTIDLGWSRNKDIRLWPIYKRLLDTNSRDVEIFFPIYRKQYVCAEKLQALRVLPFYRSLKKGSYQDFRLLSFYYPSVFRITKDSSEGLRSIRFFEVLPRFSLIDHTRSRYLDRNHFFFLFYHKKDRLSYKSHTLFLPIYFRRQVKERTTKLILPLYLSIKDEDFRFKSILPLYWHQKFYKDTQIVLFPIYWKQKTPTVKSWKLWPLLAYKKENSLKNTSSSCVGTLLLLASFKYDTYDYLDTTRIADDTDHDTLGQVKVMHIQGYHKRISLFPLWSWSVQMSQNNDTLVKQRYSHTLFPIYWKRYQTIIHRGYSMKKYGFKYDTSRVLVWFPIYWNLRSNRYHFKSIQPFYSMGRSADGKKRHWSITPLFWSFRVQVSSSLKRRHFLFPIWWHYRRYHIDNDSMCLQNKRNNIFPIYWTFKNWDKSDTSSGRVIFPFLWLYKNRAQKIDGKISVLFPFYLRVNKSDHQVVSLFPLFSWGKHKHNQSRHLAITPMYWNVAYQNGRFYSIFPFYFRRISDNSNYKPHYRIFFPFYWDYKSTNDQEGSVMGTKVLLPFYMNTQNKERRFTALLPFYLSRHHLASGNHWHVVFPFYQWCHTSLVDIKRVLGFVYVKRRYAYGNRSHSLLGGLVFHKRYAKDGGMEFRVLYQVYAKVRKGNYRESSLFPIYRKIDEGSGRETKTYFMNFYVQHQRPLGTSGEVYREVKVFWFLRLMSNYSYLKSKGLHHLVGRKR